MSISNLPYEEAMHRLKDGNARYIASGAYAGDVSANARQSTASGQSPYAVVITCSDSRVIPEAVFSAGIGELFVIRTAGNVINDFVLASVQYAVEHLGTNLVLLLGHTKCGAVGATLEGGADGFTAIITDEIKKAIGEERDEEEASRLNAQKGVEKMREAADRFLTESREVKFVSGLYHIDSGEVSFFD